MVETSIPLLQAIDMDVLLGDLNFISFLLPPAEKREVKDYNSADNMAILDYGITAGVGYTMNNLMFDLSYSLGLKDYRIDLEGDDKKRT